MKIYVILEADYESSGYPIKAFFDKDDADDFVERKRNWIERMKDKMYALSDHYNSCTIGCDCDEKLTCHTCQEYLDLNFSEFDIRYYTVQEVECE